MKKSVVYIHGKDGNAAESKHYKPLFPDHDVIGFDYKSTTPWEAKDEFPAFLLPLQKQYEQIILIANSIGAYFSMHSLSDIQIDKAFLISPITDMEQLILDMMTWAGVTKQELQERKEIPTSFGEVLSWDYLTYVRTHPIVWNIPTRILYGEKDTLTSLETITKFADRTGSALTVMKGGEHWFHTEEQMKFLDAWIKMP